MWIVGHDRDFYPVIYKFIKEEDAIKEYGYIKGEIEKGEYPEDQCVFIAEVRNYTKGREYEIIDDKTNNEIE